MLRRRLSLYTVFYIAGIAAGFFIFERSRITEAAGFSAAVFAAAAFTDMSDQANALSVRYGRGRDIDIARHLDPSGELIRRQKAILIMCFLAGLLLFAFRYTACSYALTYTRDADHVSGRVISVSMKDDKVRLVVKNIEKGPRKVLVKLDSHAASLSAEKDDLQPEEAYGHAGASDYIGALIEARGEYSDIPPADDPGCFDYGAYLKSKGITAGFNAYAVWTDGEEENAVIRARRFLYSTREAFISRFDTETQGFIRGVIFGDKSEIDEDVLEEFNSNSTGHILAVSGLHVGFLYGLLRLLTARKRTLPASLFIIIVILMYGEMTMWSPATIRACIVMTVSLLSTHLRRHSDLLTSVSLAAFLILTYQPYQLFSSGFQLSFLALCSIALLTRPVAHVTGETLAVMFAVQAGTMPLIAYSYCSIDPLAMLINVPVILLASVLVPVCILLLMAEAAAGMVPAAGIRLAELISYAVIKVNHILNFGGGFSINSASPGAAVMILFYSLLFGLASEWTRVMLLRKKLKTIMKQGILLLMPLVMLFSCLYDPISDDEIVFTAVGQGDCVHIRADGHDVLIDGGGQASYGETEGEADKGYDVGKNILKPYLMHGGADAVDMALVTHLHADHYKGIEELSRIFPVGAIGIPADYRGYGFSISGAGNSVDGSTDGSTGDQGNNRSENTKIIYIYPDTKIDITEDVYVETLWPVEVSSEPLAADDPNEHNTVYMVHYMDIKVMVTGDLLEEDEHEMVGYYQGTDTLKCDILKVAHHGSKSSSCEEFLDAVKPDIAVIQCGRNNFYGHPHRQTLDRLEERGIRVFRTDLSGAVGIDIRGSRLSVDLFRRE